MAELWPEQEMAYRFVLERDRAALFGEPRTGKTYITLMVLRKLAGDPINLATGRGNDFCGVIVGLLSNLETTWLTAINNRLKWMNVTRDWAEFVEMPCPKLFLVHFEGLAAIAPKMVRYKAINWMCIDEAHRLANRGSKISRAARRMSWVKRKLTLTGTPIESRPSDLFAQFRFLEPSLFGDNWREFEDEYMEVPKMKEAMKGLGMRQKMIMSAILRKKAPMKPGATDRIVELIKPYAFRLTKIAVGILEPNVRKRDVTMIGEQKRLYDQMKRDSMITVNGAQVTAETGGIKVMKLRQIASGFVYDDDQKCHHIGRAKLRKILQMMRWMPLPVVIFTAFRPDLEQIANALRHKGLDVAEMHGDIKKSLRPDIWRMFQLAQYDAIVCQTKTGGAGNDLWKANSIIVHSLGYSFIDFDQLKARLDHKLKKKPAQVYVLCSSKTIDEPIFDLVIKKRMTSEAVLAQLKKGVSSWPERKPRRPSRQRRSRTFPSRSSTSTT